MRAWLVVNHWLRAEVFLRHYAALEAAAQQEGFVLERRTATEVLLTDDAPEVALAMDKDTVALRALESRGTRVLNSAAAVADCDDKAMTWAALGPDIAQPETIPVPLRFVPVPAADWAEFAEHAAARLGLPLVGKRARSSLGEGVELLTDRASVQEFLARIGTESAVLQEFIAHSSGRDARLYFIGSQCIAAMERVATTGDFRSNIATGASAQPFDPPPEFIAVGQAVMRRLGLDFAGIDLLFGPTGPLVCEVNSNAQFLSLAQVSGVDIARALCRTLREAAPA